MISVSKDVTPTQVKSVITYGVRRLHGEQIRRTEPLNLSKELCELELNMLPGDRRHRAIPEPGPEPKKRLPNFSNLLKPMETQTRENSEPKINIQEDNEFKRSLRKYYSFRTVMFKS